MDYKKKYLLYKKKYIQLKNAYGGTFSTPKKSTPVGEIVLHLIQLLLKV